MCVPVFTFRRCWGVRQLLAYYITGSDVFVDTAASLACFFKGILSLSVICYQCFDWCRTVAVALFQYLPIHRLSIWFRAILLLTVEFHIQFSSFFLYCTPDHLLLDWSPIIGPLMSRQQLDKFKNCWNKSFRTSKILTILYQQCSNLLIFQRYMSGPRLGALSNKRVLGVHYVS
jgi:hypothetical protein